MSCYITIFSILKRNRIYSYRGLCYIHVNYYYYYYDYYYYYYYYYYCYYNICHVMLYNICYVILCNCENSVLFAFGEKCKTALIY